MNITQPQVGRMEPVTEAYRFSVESVAEQLQTDPGKGLPSAEAERRLRVFGPNELQLRRRKNLLRLLLEQFLSPLVGVLLVAAVLAFSFQEWLEGSAILVVILINALIGFFMEWQAIRSMEALRRLAQTNSRVYRDGGLTLKPSGVLVPGDLLYLEAGDVVPADCRLVETQDVGISEAALTGESIGVEKQTEALPGEKVPLADRTNQLFKGTTVTHGNAKALVVATGEATQLGRIARMAQEATKEATPLEEKLGLLSQRLLWLTFVLAFLILGLGLLQGRDFYLMTKTAIALAIAAIPEGLPIVATIALARGMLRLARHQVVVKKLSAVQTLGETEVIFTDKTGTLTENRLSVDTLVFEFGEARVKDEDGALRLEGDEAASFRQTKAFTKLIEVGVLCNNAALGEDHPVGDPLEIALLRFAERAGTSVAGLRGEFPREDEIPFDSDLKMMGTLHRNPARENYLVCIKGAAEVVLAESDHVVTTDGQRPLDDREAWQQRADELAAMGLRMLAFAYSEIEAPKDEFAHNLILLGLVGFLDPAREDVGAALATCRAAGIGVVMVTGDHPETARNIAYRTGLTDRPEAPAIHGRELAPPETLSPAEKEKLLAARIFARVSPAQKLDLITLFQENGQTVGMTGDGINDAPALKKADIGIAMGERGTEAAKDVADLILKDDAFQSIVVAIRQGRGIFENIRYFVVYLLSCNLSEILVVAFASFASLAMPLLPLQILFLNMVTDVFPALALGMNREAENIMEKPPRRNREPILDRSRWTAVVGYALGITIACIAVLLYATRVLDAGPSVANTMTFYTLILAQLWNVFNLTGADVSFWRNEVTTNRYVWYAIALCLGITVVAYLLPAVREVLNLQHLDGEQYGLILAVSLFPVLFVQVLKRLRLLI